MRNFPQICILFLGDLFTMAKKQFPEAICPFCEAVVDEIDHGEHGACAYQAVYEIVGVDDLSEYPAELAYQFGIDEFDSEAMATLECRSIRGWDKDEYGNEDCLAFVKKRE